MLTTLKEATLIIWIFQAYLGVDCSLAGECCLHCVEPNKADTSAVKFCGTGAVARVELDDPIFLRGETVDDSPCLVHRQPSEVNRTRCEAISTSEDLQLSHEEKMEALANKWATEMEAGLKQIKESDPGLAKLLEEKQVFTIVPWIFASSVANEIDVIKRMTRKREDFDFKILGKMIVANLLKQSETLPVSEFSIPDLPTMLKSKSTADYILLRAEFEKTNYEINSILLDELSKKPRTLKVILENSKRINSLIDGSSERYVGINPQPRDFIEELDSRATKTLKQGDQHSGILEGFQKQVKKRKQFDENVKKRTKDQKILRKAKNARLFGIFQRISDISIYHELKFETLLRLSHQDSLNNLMRISSGPGIDPIATESFDFSNLQDVKTIKQLEKYEEETFETQILVQVHILKVLLIKNNIVENMDPNPVKLMKDEILRLRKIMEESKKPQLENSTDFSYNLKYFKDYLYSN